MLERTFQRQTFGKFLYEHGSCRELIADSASDLESARLLTLACAEEIDRLGARGARDKIALIKVTVPELTSRVVDRAVQVSVMNGQFVLLCSQPLMCSMNRILDIWRSRCLQRFSTCSSAGRLANASYSGRARCCAQAVIGFA